MSNSELLHIKDDNDELGNSKVFKKPPLKSQTECRDSISMSSDFHSQGQENEDDKQEEHFQGKIVLSKQSDSEAGSSSSRAKNKVEDEEDEGFRTPTSLDHGIPVTKQCPHAPRKPKPSLKRKPLCNPPVDLSKEVVELLLPTHHKTMFSSHQSSKKVRRE